MVRKDPVTGSISAQAQQDLLSDGIENFELPKSVITKIARSAIPENAKLQKETILSLVKGSTVFVNYLAATAHDVAISKQHKSISATDVLRALEVLELGDLVDGLQSELQIYRELAKTDKSKKGTSTIISASTRGKQTAGSASTPVATPAGSPLKIQLKQKEKAGAVTLPSPFSSAPLSSRNTPNESISTGPASMDVDDLPPAAEDQEMAEAVEEEEEEIVDDDVDEEDEEEPDDLQDTVALEEEELRLDAKALDEPGPSLAGARMGEDD